MADEFKLGVVLLAAGASRRFAGIKQLATLSDPVSQTCSSLQKPPMLQSALEVLSRLSAYKKLVTLGANKEAIMTQIQLPDGINFSYVSDWDEGIAASIRNGIKALQDCSHVLIILADQPNISLSVYTCLIDKSKNNLKDIICARYEQENAVPAIFPAPYFALLRALKGDKGAGKLLNTSKEISVIAMPLENGAFDIDTQKDLATWRKQNKRKNENDS